MRPLPVDLTDTTALMREIERRRRLQHRQAVAAVAASLAPRPVIPVQRRPAQTCPTCRRPYVRAALGQVP